MNGRQHYNKAEVLLLEASEMELQMKNSYFVQQALMKAQVHATLALAAWTAAANELASL